MSKLKGCPLVMLNLSLLFGVEPTNFGDAQVELGWTAGKGHGQ